MSEAEINDCRHSGKFTVGLVNGCVVMKCLKCGAHKVSMDPRAQHRPVRPPLHYYADMARGEFK